MKIKSRIIVLGLLVLGLQSCDRDEENGNLIIAVDNTSNTSGIYNILIDGKMKGTLIREPNFKASGYVNCGDDWVKISKTTNVSVVTDVSGGKHKVELQRQGDNIVVVNWDIKMNSCEKVVAVF